MPQHTPIASSSQPIAFSGRRVVSSRPTIGKESSVSPKSTSGTTPVVDQLSPEPTPGVRIVNTTATATSAMQSGEEAPGRRSHRPRIEPSRHAPAG